ncbi:MAG: bifunctional UDP-3-O-[3-hydroxymyristoyl] N-acetylglucosamine deacetylase/3-hydroxyacyl-ACP dehydratase [Bacteroidota bacterium]|nr:bifunctional UDP-3-O-[3-hydroxymyristoyl] N-acetylglucosamine deacetylase/3-hydroxyacyl-ACP dehydratase [Bacteroidota bacterium]
MNEKQKTLIRPVTISGRGLHTGEKVTVIISPVPANFGYKFKRVDLEEQPIIEADANYVVDTSRGTTLQKNNIKLHTTEHCLAALVGKNIDNALIEIDGPELPILDGSSKLFIEAINKAGIKELEEDRNFFELKENIIYRNEENDIEIIAMPCDKLKVSTIIDYNSKALPPQIAKLDNISDFEKEIAPCRTFVFLHELEPLIKHELIKGGDLENAIVFVENNVKQEELDKLKKFFNKPSIEIKGQGILNNLDLQFDNEPARHKLLDVIGDLATVGRPLKARIITTRPGHGANNQFARMLKKHIANQEKIDKTPHYDVEKEPIFNINDIKKMLPHRSPFLLVDKVIEMDEKRIIGIKNITMDEPFFVGHFPNEPVMPGVLQIEALAQCGGIFTLSSVPDPENYQTLFAKINNVRFRKKVIPGDTLILVLELMSPIRRGMCQMRGKAYVGNQVVTEADLLAQIAKK